MEGIEQLIRNAAFFLGLQHSRGRDSRYVGVCQLKKTGKWYNRTAARPSQKADSLFDLEIQAALDFRMHQLDTAGHSKEAQELRQVAEAMKEIASELLKILCSCQTPGARCHCKEKALREAEAAKAALEAIRAAAQAPMPPPMVPNAPRAKTIEQYYSTETVRKQHQLDRRRAKESRRRFRRQQLEGTLQTHLVQEQEADPGNDESAKVDSEGGFTTLRRHFLQQVQRKRKRFRDDPEGRYGIQLLERFAGSGVRVIAFRDAAKRLRELSEQKEARQRLQESATMGEQVPMTPQGRNLDISAELEVAPKAAGRPKNRRLRTPTDILLKRLVQKQQQEVEKAKQAAGEEVQIVSMELNAVKGELARMNKAKAAKLEWLLLQRLAPEPVLTNVKLCDEEREAQLEEERLQKLWELEGGAEEEERVAKEWRGIMRQRRERFLAHRGARSAVSRWLRRRAPQASQAPQAPQAPTAHAPPREEPTINDTEAPDEVAVVDPYL